MKKELTVWADSVIEMCKRPKFVSNHAMWENKKIETRTNKGMLFGVHGKLQSGKDTAGQLLVEKYDFQRLAFADALRTSLYNLNPIVDFVLQTDASMNVPETNTEDFMEQTITTKTVRSNRRVQNIVDKLGWEEAKKKYPEIRRLLQYLGTESGRDIHGQECWTDIVKRELQENFGQSYVITDVRFPNEKTMIESMGGYMIHIIRDQTVTEADNHASEQVLEGIKHKILNNGSLEDLHTAVYTMLKHLESDKAQEPLTVKCMSEEEIQDIVPA